MAAQDSWFAHLAVEVPGTDASTEWCEPVSDETIESTDASEETEGVSENRVLIAYFGRWGNTEFSDDVDASASASIVVGKDGNLEGTTEYVAELIQEHTGGDLHLIQTADPYPVDYDTVVDQNHQEQEDGFVPELESNEKTEYSVSVAKLVKTVMNVSMRYAVDNKIISDSPAHGIRLPKKVKSQQYHTL